jgi:hypothetical protein
MRVEDANDGGCPGQALDHQNHMHLLTSVAISDRIQESLTKRPHGGQSACLIAVGFSITHQQRGSPCLDKSRHLQVMFLVGIHTVNACHGMPEAFARVD